MTQETPNHKITVSGWAAHDSAGVMTPYTFKRRVTGEDDVSIKILYCGICHTDLHFIKNELGNTIYPIVPGHEITGIVTEVGSNVKGFKIGDRVGVGGLAATCLQCEFCKASEETYCDKAQLCFNGVFWDGSKNYGGYSEMIVTDHRYVVHLPDNLPMDAAAPLLCAGVTVYTPMVYAKLHESTGKRIGVVGLGGLGHVAIKIGKAFGHHVTVISTSLKKEKEAREHLGADDFIVSSDPEQMQSKMGTLDFILDTVSVHHAIVPLIDLLKKKGILHLLGGTATPLELPSLPLVFGKKTVTASFAGSIRETQEMLDFCGKHNITCDIETIKPDYLNEALDRLHKNDVKYRFVIKFDDSDSSQ